MCQYNWHSAGSLGLAECCKRQLNRGSFVFCCILGCLLFLISVEFVYLYFPVLFCLSVSVKWLAVKTASEMTYIVLSGALNSTPTNQSLGWPFPMLKYKYIVFQIKYTEGILPNSTLGKCYGSKLPKWWLPFKNYNFWHTFVPYVMVWCIDIE